MSNYGHNYGSLEKYAEEKARQRELDFLKLKKAYALVRIDDKWHYLNKNDDSQYDSNISEETFLVKTIGKAFDKIDEVERKYKGLRLRTQDVYIEKEWWDTL